MMRQNVDSTTVKSVGYDPEGKALEVEFSTGRVYQYFDVPQEVYDDFVSAPSKGSFFHHKIKNQSFPFKRIEVDFE